MDNPRLFLLIALSFVGLLLFQAWQEDYGPQTTRTASQTGADAGNDVPRGPADGLDAAKVPAPADVPQAPSAGAAPDRPTVQADRLPSAERVHVRTDVLDVELDTYGGDIRSAKLLKYSVSIDDKTPIALLQESADDLYVAQSGFSMVKGAGPDHHATYQVPRTDYRLAEGQDQVQVDMTWSAGGVEVVKRYIFHRGSYAIDVQYQVRNNRADPWQGAFYRQIKRTPGGDSGPQLFGI